MGEPVQRVLLKLSGEVLAASGGAGFDLGATERIAGEIVEAQREGLEIALVIGGGNLLRGEALSRSGIARVTCDHMGMLATIMNALALRDVLIRAGAAATLLSALPVASVAEGFSQRRATALLDAGEVVLFAGGTGNPYFTTDSAACLRAIEIGADLVLKATQVDGVYDRDPNLDASAQHYAHLSYDEVIRRELGVMDLTAICLCREHGMPLMVFRMDQPDALRRIAAGETLGTLVDDDGD